MAAQSRSDIRSALPARSSPFNSSARCGAAKCGTAWSRCAWAAGRAPRRFSRISKADMDFDLSPELVELRNRVAAFVRDEVIPAEKGTPDIDALRQKARKAGIYGPQLPREYGGLGLGTVAMCVVFEQAGRSFLGPLALNCAAPDEGNMHLLSLYATAA